jgi:anti-sigma B factor antagonist
LEISHHQQSGITILRIRGDIRRGDPTDQLKGAVDELIDQGQSKIVLNLGEVNMIDSTGIGIIVRAHTRTVERGGGLRLVNPSKFAMQTLKIVGLLNILAIADSEETAVESYAE